MTTVKVNVCGVAEHSPQKVGDKAGLSTGVVQTQPNQLATHMLETTTIGKHLYVNRLTCNSGVSFRNGSNMLITMALSV